SFFFQAVDGIRDFHVTGVQTCALPILSHRLAASPLFSDDALAALIDKTPREAYHVNYSQRTPGNPPKRREGEIKGLTGHDVLEEIGRASSREAVGFFVCPKA